MQHENETNELKQHASLPENAFRELKPGETYTPDTSIAHAYILSTLIIFIFFPSVLFLKMVSVCFYEFGFFGA